MNAIIDKLTLEEVKLIFEKQQNNQYRIASRSVDERKKKLRALKQAIEITYRKEIQEALLNDMHKNPLETDLTEIYPIVGEIKHALAHINNWAGKNSVATPLAFLGASSRIKYEPKGVCLIISPWNFPFNLSFGPLVSAIAAGNTAIIKPSEFTPHSSNLIKKIVADIFSRDEVTVVEGGVETSTSLLSLPFNHIFFTGSPKVGKIVMGAAAKNLASVTLELGGKSPTIVDETANISEAARRITWGKFLNSGQICIAPDYVVVHENKKEALILELSKQLDTFFGKDAEKSDAFTRIVNQNNAERMQGLIEDAKAKGAKIAYGGSSNVAERYIQPTLLTDISQDAIILEEEIFGPILPIITYKNIDEVIKDLESKEKPLALYIYSKNRSTIKKIIEGTRSGNVCVNFNDVHFFNSNIPFGGANNSGIGKAHGFYGFQEFSNAKGIFTQHIPSGLELMMPPYTNFKKRLINLTIKWF